MVSRLPDDHIGSFGGKRMKAMHVAAISSSIYRGYRRWRQAKVNETRSLV